MFTKIETKKYPHFLEFADNLPPMTSRQPKKTRRRPNPCCLNCASMGLLRYVHDPEIHLCTDCGLQFTLAEALHSMLDPEWANYLLLLLGPARQKWS
jgi:hypothetical protein